MIFNVHFFLFLACLNNNNNTVQDVLKNIHDKGPSYVSNISKEDFVQSVMDQATNSLTKQMNSSANTSSRLHISLNILDRGAQDDVGNLNES